MKCRTSEISATTSNMWISPLATWNTVQPRIHAMRRITNRIVKMLIGLLSSREHSREVFRMTAEILVDGSLRPYPVIEPPLLRA